MTRPLGHWLLLFALVAMWGSAFLFTGIAVRGFSPTALVAIRLAIAAVLLTSLVALRRERFPWTRRFWLFSIAISLAGNCVPFWLISFGQQRIDSGLAGILMGIMPLTTMALAHFFVPGERLNAIKIAGFMVGFGGLLTLMGPEALLELRGQGTELLHQLAVLGGAVCYAINAIVARHRPPADPLVAAAGVMLAGSVIMLPIGAVPARTELLVAPPAPLGAMLALSIVATAIATVVFLKLVTVAGPSFTSFINYLIPVWALLMGVMFLGEQPGARVVIALVLILAGIAL
ncbi:MAG TPA: DMT family transporter, partial [Geminicoccaceae bacterium]|nr:DMT family transporter [Geminicoccaceae bacterium]